MTNLEWSVNRCKCLIPGLILRYKTSEKISVLHKNQNIFRGLTPLIFGFNGFSPIMNILYCFLISSAASCGLCDQEKGPSLRRLYKNKNPFPCQRSPWIRSPWLPHKRNKTSFSKRFRSYLVPISCAIPSIPLRKSVRPQAIMILFTPPTSVSMMCHFQKTG